MNIPGANLLSMASRVIRFETIGHRAFVSRTANAAGDFVSTFAASVDIQGSMQPLNKKTYQELGLNLTKNYVMLYTSATITPPIRDHEGDLLTFGGKTWQCESDQSWAAIDGFTKMLCVEVPPYE
jgi:hypothetical protein